jgi:hypothetical protein
MNTYNGTAFSLKKQADDAKAYYQWTLEHSSAPELKSGTIFAQVTALLQQDDTLIATETDLKKAAQTKLLIASKLKRLFFFNEYSDVFENQHSYVERRSTLVSAFDYVMLENVFLPTGAGIPGPDDDYVGDIDYDQLDWTTERIKHAYREACASAHELALAALSAEREKTYA